MGRSWIWMAIFSAIFVVVGGVELAQGDEVAGGGYLVCGMGAALVTGAQRGSGEAGSGRWLAIVGTVGMAVGIVVLVIHLFA